MVNRTKLPTFLAVLLALALLGAALLTGPGCAAISGLFSMSSMSDEEFKAWYPTAAAEVGAALRGAQREGKLSPESAQAWASQLEGVADGTKPVPPSLAEWFGVEGWGSVALEIAVIDLDSKLARSGSWGPAGVALERAKIIAGALALEFDSVAAAPPPPGG